MFGASKTVSKVYDNMATRYRPITLDDIVGQRVAISKVEGFLFQEKIPRAILISGPYGAGKTTLARMIARYLNCLKHGPKKCCAEMKEEKFCRACAQMGAMPNLSDYQELNAAEARGINDVRGLIELASMSPQTNYRIFCLDEAHQFTSQASQALLKPLEEPSPRTVWIICTTAPEKILPTIRSRCFPINVTHVKPAQCLPWLKGIAEKEEAPEMPDSIYEQIIQASHGHPRTALNALESVIAYVAARGAADLDKAIDEVIKDVVKNQPEVVAEKYVRFLLNGSVVALGSAGSVENPELFLQLVSELFMALILAFAGQESRVEKYHMDFVLKTKWKREFTVGKNLEDMVRIQRIFMAAHKEAKEYILDGQQLVDAATLEVLSITSKWEKVKA